MLLERKLRRCCAFRLLNESDLPHRGLFHVRLQGRPGTWSLAQGRREPKAGMRKKEPETAWSFLPSASESAACFLRPHLVCYFSRAGAFPVSQMSKSAQKTELVCTESSWFVTSLKASCCCLQLLSRVQVFVTPWTAARQAPLSFTISWSLLKFKSVESVEARTIVQLLAAGSTPPLFPSVSIFPSSWKMSQITAPGVLLFLRTPLPPPCPTTLPSLPLLPCKDHPQVPESVSL